MDKNIYIFAGESYMVKQSLKKLKGSLGIQYPEINISEYRAMPKVDELIGVCSAVPFMSSLRLVAVEGCTGLSAKGSVEEAKKITDFLSALPETTVLALCIDDVLDKRRTLYKEVKKYGQVSEYAAPSRPDCINFTVRSAKEAGASISVKAAADLVSAVGCDYYTLENEIAKLCAYCGPHEITCEDVAACASKSLEYNVFEIHGLLVNKQAESARKLLEDIQRAERPEALVGLIAKKFRDMYKIKTMTDAGFKFGRIAGLLGINSYVVEMLAKDCKRFTQQELRDGLTALADLDYTIKSGEADASLAMSETLFRIYKLDAAKKASDLPSPKTKGLVRK